MCSARHRVLVFVSWGVSVALVSRARAQRSKGPDVSVRPLFSLSGSKGRT